MTQDKQAKAAARELAAVEGISYTAARRHLQDPANQVLCEECGWTVAMICPECPGCGCYNAVCSGWRHEEYMDEDERAELAACADRVGAGTAATSSAPAPW